MLAAPAPAALSPTKVLFADSFADDEGPPLSPAARPYTASLLADRPGTKDYDEIACGRWHSPLPEV